MARRPFEDDDGRTVADMSSFEQRTPFGFRQSRDKKNAAKETDTESRPWEKNRISRETQKGVIWGALSASLLIALAFIVGLGIVIALFCWIFAWK